MALDVVNPFTTYSITILYDNCLKVNSLRQKLDKTL
jgi:hypothetical protein